MRRKTTSPSLRGTWRSTRSPWRCPTGRRLPVPSPGWTSTRPRASSRGRRADLHGVARVGGRRAEGPQIVDEGLRRALHVVRRGLDPLLREVRRVRELRRDALEVVRPGGHRAAEVARPGCGRIRLAVGPIVGAAASRCGYRERDGSSSEGENATHDRTLAGSGGDQHEERDDRPRRELACRA